MEKKKGQIRKVSFWIITAVVFLCVGTAILTTSPIYLKKCHLVQGRHLSKCADKQSKRYGLTAFGRKSEVKKNADQIPSQNFLVPAEKGFIKRADLNMEVKSCEAVTQKILELVDDFSGIIVDSSIEKYPNKAKQGRAVLRILPKDFDKIIAQLKELGKVSLVRIRGEDVSEEYVDIEARLKNLRTVKERLFKVLKDNASTVKDILEVERELSRLSEQIERIEGRKKCLDRQIGLATVTVNFSEPKVFSPEPLNIIRKFKQALRAAIEAFINVFNGIIVVIAALLPIAIWIGAIFAIAAVGKRCRKDNKNNKR